MVYKKRDKKEEQEVQNTLPLKSEGKKWPKTVSCFMNVNSIATVNWFQEFDKSGIIFQFCHAFAIA